MTLPAEERRRPLNHAEACKRARELWGAAGRAEERQREPLGRRFVVGTVGALPDKVAFGRGATWEEAFEDAERNRSK